VRYDIYIYIYMSLGFNGLRITIISVSGTTKELMLITSHMKTSNCGKNCPNNVQRGAFVFREPLTTLGVRVCKKDF
jgi:hypothetical protein